MSIRNSELTFGQWMHLKRKKELGFTLQQLADRSGYSRSYLSQLERDEPNGPLGTLPRPNPETVDRVADALGVSRAEARMVAGYLPENWEQLCKLTPIHFYYYDEDVTDDDQKSMEQHVRLIWEAAKKRARQHQK